MHVSTDSSTVLFPSRRSSHFFFYEKNSSEVDIIFLIKKFPYIQEFMETLKTITKIVAQYTKMNRKEYFRHTAEINTAK